MNRTCFASAAAAALAAAGLAPGQGATDLSGLLDRAAPSIVTVKVVIKIEMSMMGQGQNEESRSELQGVIVDESGLVMISNAEISEDRLKESLSSNPMMGQVDFKMTPTDFKVIFGNEPEEHAAFLVAKDTKLDLAFLQVQGIEGRELAAVSFAGGGTPTVGERVVSVSRLKKGYDYAPYFSTARISGAIRKPRKAWTLDGALAGYGLPVFAETGEVVGALVTLPPATKDEDPAGAGFGSLMRFMRGGGLEPGVGTFVLPAKVVDGLIEQSKKMREESTDTTGS